jgi:hypothetical protein
MPPLENWLMKLMKSPRSPQASSRREDNHCSQQGAGRGNPLLPIVFNNGSRTRSLWPGNGPRLVESTPTERVTRGLDPRVHLSSK